MVDNYRKGATGALMDEYERAARELKTVMSQLSIDDYIKIVDPHSPDKDCSSIRFIMNHVIRAGYGYANYIRKYFGYGFTERKENYDVETPAKACEELDKMLDYTVETLSNKWDLTEKDVISSRIETRWGQVYDFEQLMEHAIVHVLRHRRQIEKIILVMKDENFVSPLENNF